MFSKPADSFTTVSAVDSPSGVGAIYDSLKTFTTSLAAGILFYECNL